MNEFSYILLTADGHLYDVLISPAPLPATIELQGDAIIIKEGNIQNRDIAQRMNDTPHTFRLTQELSEKQFLYIEY